MSISIEHTNFILGANIHQLKVRERERKRERERDTENGKWKMVVYY